MRYLKETRSNSSFRCSTIKIINKNYVWMHVAHRRRTLKNINLVSCCLLDLQLAVEVEEYTIMEL